MKRKRTKGKWISGKKPNVRLGYTVPMTSAALVADYLVLKARNEGWQLTNKRLQKLLYYIQAWSLALNGQPVFRDTIEAWIHGPAIRSVYEEYKSFVANPITTIKDEKIAEKIDKTFITIIDRVCKSYSIYDTATLEFMTHSESPWQDARRGLEVNQSSTNEITLDSMRNYYSARLKEVE
jgi:uncharacterized phage-associated protein